MAQVIFTESASADEAAILSYLKSKAGFLVASKFRSLFKTLYKRLGEYPDSGPPRPALGADIRIGIISPYIVIYRHPADDDAVTVLRIVHGHRRITGKLLIGT